MVLELVAVAKRASWSLICPRLGNGGDSAHETHSLCIRVIARRQVEGELTCSRVCCCRSLVELVEHLIGAEDDFVTVTVFLEVTEGVLVPLLDNETDSLFPEKFEIELLVGLRRFEADEVDTRVVALFLLWFFRLHKDNMVNGDCQGMFALPLFVKVQGRLKNVMEGVRCDWWASGFSLFGFVVHIGVGIDQVGWSRFVSRRGKSVWVCCTSLWAEQDPAVLGVVLVGSVVLGFVAVVRVVGWTVVPR